MAKKSNENRNKGIFFLHLCRLLFVEFHALNAIEIESVLGKSKSNRCNNYLLFVFGLFIMLPVAGVGLESGGMEGTFPYAGACTFDFVLV